MKKILVPTDFSENSIKALHYAIEIANKFNAKIYVLHAYQISSGAGRLVSIDHIIQEDREQELNVIIRKIKPLLGENTHLESFVKRGGSVDLICKTAEKLDIDLIIMGTTGASGMKKIFMGSTASNVLKNTNVPVLAIPSDFGSFNLSNITLALDNNTLDNKFIIKPLIDIVKKFDTTLNLLFVVNEDNEHTDIDSHIQDLLKQFGVNFTYYKLTSEDSSQGILDFIENKNSNMLCIIHYNIGWLKDLFHSSVSEDMAFESKIPLLVLRG